MSEDILDTLRNFFILAYLFAICPWNINASQIGGQNVEFEFRAYRLQQFDLSGNIYGSRSWRVLYEAVSLNGSALRKCVIVSWRDLIGKDLENTLGASVGAVIVIIPFKLDSLGNSDQQLFSDVEYRLANFKTEQAVFVVPGNESLNSLLHEVGHSSQRAPTAVQQLYNAVVANNFQITSSSTASTNVLSAKYHNVIARLSSFERNSPTLMFVAHYDSHSTVPALSTGADSNGSGIAALLELLAIFKKFYSSTSNRPKFNMIFLFSAGGKFNYQGSRQFLDDYLEKQTDEHIELVVCLEALGRENSLYAHVSKFPPEGSATAKMYEWLKIFSNDQHPVELVTKKINLGIEWLAWEHEIYNIRRMPAMTLSHFEKFNNNRRNSMLDTLSSVDFEVLSTNVHILVNSVLAYVFDLDINECKHVESPNQRCALLSTDDVNRERLRGFLEAFGTSPRPMATSSTKLVKELVDITQKYATGRVIQQEVHLLDLQLYGVLEDKFIAHIVKPSVFELLLAAIIGSYLYFLYFLAQNAQSILELAVVRLRKMVS